MFALLALVLPALAQEPRTAESDDSFRWYMPVLSSDEYRSFWNSDNPSVLNTVTLGTGFDDGNVAGSLFAELLQDNLGPSGYPIFPADLKDGLPFVFRAQFFPNG